MKKGLPLNKNQKGSTLLIVIFAIVFVGSLGSLILSATLANYQMKNIDMGSKTNYYYVEKAVDEIYAAIGVEATQSMANAYIYVLSTLVSHDPINGYQSINNADANDRFRNTFYDNIKTSLYRPTEAEIKGVLESYLSIEASGEQAVVESVGSFDISTTPYVIRNVRVSHTNSNGYYTSINTDIVIQAPDIDINFTSPTDMNWDEVFSYFAIGQNKVDIGTNAKVTGNVYGGNGGINIMNPHKEKIEVTMNTRNIVTTGPLAVQYATLNLDGRLGGAAQIFAQNILTSGFYSRSLGYGSGVQSKLNVKANMVIQENLEVNGDGSKVNLSGNYYGYGIHTDASGNEEKRYAPEGSSCIVINGKSADVDLRALETLLVAGRAYVDITGSGGIRQGTYMTGESISVKGNQIAYLADVSSIPNMNNPMSATAFDTAVANGEITPPSDIIKVQVDDLYYFYNEPLDPPAQTSKFMNDFRGNLDRLQQRVESLDVKNLLIGNPAKRYTTGSMVEVKDGKLQDDIKKGSEGSFCNTDAKFNEMLKDLAYRTSAITTLLCDHRGVMELGKRYVDVSAQIQERSGNPYSNYVNVNAVKSVTGENYTKTVPNYQYEDESGNIKTRSVYIAVRGEDVIDFNVPVTAKYGIIIAHNNVHVSSDFTGIVFAGGTVSVYDGALANLELVADVAMVDTLFQMVKFDDGKMLGSFLNGYLSSGTAPEERTINDVDYQQLVQYENWTKNAVETY